MKRLLACLVLCASFSASAQENSNYDPDYDGNGCITISDILGILPLYGICPPLDTVLWAPAGSLAYNGHEYPLLQIGNQYWFTENLRSQYFLNGDSIPNEIIGFQDSPNQVVYGQGTVYCNNSIFDLLFDTCDETISLNIYGRLYNWYAVNDGRGLCPLGWRVPSDQDWIVLETALGMSLDEALTFGNRGGYENLGAMLKDDTGYWRGSGNGTNDFGFSVLPGSYFLSGAYGFNYAGWNGYLWTSTDVNDGTEAILRDFAYSSPGIRREAWDKDYHYSIRCMKDSE